MNHVLSKRSVTIIVISAAIAFFCAPPDRIEASSTIIDPGPTGSSFSYQRLAFDALIGMPFNGQTVSLDVVFAENKFLVTSGGSIDLFINQTGELGTWPESFSMTGYLLDSEGNQLDVPFSYGGQGSMPAQIWPGWNFFLPDGTEYLPATSYNGRLFAGTHVADPSDPSTGYFIDPIVFSGLHFDITLPVNTSTSVIGSALMFADFAFPMYVSPDPLPEFYVHVPETSTIVLLAASLFAVAGLGRRLGGWGSEGH